MLGKAYHKVLRPRSVVGQHCTFSSGPRVVLLSGTTGVGKSFMAAKLAQAVNGELISADSVKVYRKLDILSNKTSILVHAKEHGVPVHMIDVVDPTEEFSMAEFCLMGQKIMKDIISRGKIPIIFGGACFYAESLISWDPENKTPKRDAAVAKRITDLLARDNSWEKSLERLAAVDPTSAALLNRNDYFRLVRALEIYETSGRPKSSFAMKHSPESKEYDVRGFFLTQPRIELYHDLDKRCEKMVARGLLKEILDVFIYRILNENPNIDATQLRNLVYSEYPTSSMSIGCKEAVDYLVDLWETPVLNPPKFLQFLETFQVHTRHFAKRQISWFRNSKTADYVWMPSKGTASQKYPFIESPEPITDDTKDQVEQIRKLIMCSEQEFKEEVASPEHVATKKELAILQKEQERLQKEYMTRQILYAGPAVANEIDQTIGLIKAIKAQ